MAIVKLQDPFALESAQEQVPEVETGPIRLFSKGVEQGVQRFNLGLAQTAANVGLMDKGAVADVTRRQEQTESATPDSDIVSTGRFTGEVLPWMVPGLGTASKTAQVAAGATGGATSYNPAFDEGGDAENRLFLGGVGATTGAAAPLVGRWLSTKSRDIVAGIPWMREAVVKLGNLVSDVTNTINESTLASKLGLGQPGTPSSSQAFDQARRKAYDDIDNALQQQYGHNISDLPPDVVKDLDSLINKSLKRGADVPVDEAATYGVAKKYGIEPTPGQFRGADRAVTERQLAETNIDVDSLPPAVKQNVVRIRKALEDNEKAFGGAVEQTKTLFPKSKTPAETSNVLIDMVEANREVTKEFATGPAWELAQQDAKLPVPKDKVDDVIQALEELDKSGYTEIIDRLKSYQKILLDRVDGETGTIPTDNLYMLRKSMSEHISGKTATPEEKWIYGDLISTIDNALPQSYKDAIGVSAAGFKDLKTGFINDIVKRKYTPSSAADKLLKADPVYAEQFVKFATNPTRAQFKNTPLNAQAQADLISQGRAMIEDIRAYTVNKLMDGVYENGTINAMKFNQNLAKMPNANIFLEPKELAKLKGVAQALAKKLKTGEIIPQRVPENNIENMVKNLLVNYMPSIITERLYGTPTTKTISKKVGKTLNWFDSAVDEMIKDSIKTKGYSKVGNTARVSGVAGQQMGNYIQNFGDNK